MSTNPVVDKNGTKRWYNKDGELHRVDGPAIEWYDGDKTYFIDGKYLTEEEFNQQIGD